MSNRVKITVAAEFCSVLDCGETSVDPADFAHADLSPEDLAGIVCDTIRKRAETARYGHRPRRETAPATAADYGTDDTPD